VGGNVAGYPGVGVFPPGTTDPVSLLQNLDVRDTRLAQPDRHQNAGHAGDSAGGNLTVCSALDLSAAARQHLAGAATLYPAADHPQHDWPSYREEARSGPLTTGIMRWFWDTYLGNTPIEQAPNARPLRSQRLGQLPPLFSITAGRDPLRDEGQAFADAVNQQGVDVRHRHFPGAAHGFTCSEGPTGNFNVFMEDFCDWLGSLK